MPGKQAKLLSVADLNDLLVFASCSRNPLRNRVIVLLSAKAGLRAGEIANLTWDMVLDATGRIGDVLELRDSAAKKGSGRINSHASASPRRSGRLGSLFSRARLRGGIGARRPDDAAQHRRVVQPGV